MKNCRIPISISGQIKKPRPFYSILRNLRFLIPFVTSITLNAQITQPLRYERPHKNSEHEFIIISMSEKGIALVRDTEKFEGKKQLWEVIFLDSLLQETWNTKIEVEQRMNILGHDYRDGNIYLIFQGVETAARTIQITELVTGNKTIRNHFFKPEVNIHFTHFSVLENKALFGGYINREPALLMYDLQEEKARVIPSAFQPNVDLVDVRVNINNTFNTLLIEGRNSKAKKMVIRTFDSGGVLLVDDVIPVEEGKTILQAVTSSLIRDEILIVGTWTYGNNKLATGIFSVVVDPFQDQKINFYDFAMLNHFLDNLKPKKAARIKARADWRRSHGRPADFRKNLNPIKIEETRSGFCFLGEPYDVNTYNTRNQGFYPGYYSPYSAYSPYGYYPYGFSPMPYRYYNAYSPYNSFTNTQGSYTSDIKISDAAVVFFDARGNLTSDLLLRFPEIRLSSKEQVSDFIWQNGKTTMACKTEKEIAYKIVESDGVVSKEDKVKPEIKNTNEVIFSEKDENTSIRMWYDKYFFVYGYHTLRDAIKKSHRDVFYINKIKVD